MIVNQLLSQLSLVFVASVLNYFASLRSIFVCLNFFEEIKNLYLIRAHFLNLCMFSGQMKCDPCPLNTFAMMGASKCIPLPKCTKDDIISAPGNLNTCSCNNTGVCTTKVQEKLVTVALKGELTYRKSSITPPLNDQVCSLS